MATFLTVDYALWFLALGLEVVLLTTLIRTGRAQRYPWLAVYIAYHLCRDGALFGLSVTFPHYYNVVFWLSYAVSPVLVLGNARAVLAQCSTLLDMREKRLLWMLGEWVGVLALVAVLAHPNLTPPWDRAMLQNVERLAAIVLAGVSLVTIAASETLALSIRPHCRAICGGFLISNMAMLLKSTLRATLGRESVVPSWIAAGGFCVALVVWWWGLRRDEPELLEPTPQELERIGSLLDDFGLYLQKARH